MVLPVGTSVPNIQIHPDVTKVLLQQHQKIQQVTSQTKADASSRIKLGRGDQQSESEISLEILRWDAEIDRRGSEIRQTMEKMRLSLGGVGPGITSEVDMMCENLRKDIDAGLTAARYKKLTVKLDSFADDLGKVKFGSTCPTAPSKAPEKPKGSYQAGLAGAFCSPELADRLYQQDVRKPQVKAEKPTLAERIAAITGTDRLLKASRDDNEHIRREQQ